MQVYLDTLFPRCNMILPLPGMDCNHYPTSSVFVVFHLGHFVAIRYQDKLYVSSADSEINLAQERIGTVLKYLSGLLFFTLH